MKLIKEVIEESVEDDDYTVFASKETIEALKLSGDDSLYSNSCQITK